MDIRTWLDGTVRPEPPPSPDPLEKPGPPRFLRSKEPERQAKPKARRTQRQKPSISDSSLLAAPEARKRTPPTKSEADIDGSGDDSACSDAYHPAHHASMSSTSSQQYARCPRRKTRPELYEPTSKDAKERGTQLYRRPRGESNKSKRKSRRKKAAKPGVGLVQSFHAKNVPKDRLTLRPREKLGLFNKGRASTPVKGRGLPDLVFSEMKFLQKHRDQPELSAQAGSSSKKRKKDSGHATKEEISAYFTSVRPPLAENDVNIQAKEDTRRKLLPLNTGGKRERSTLIESAMHTVELPDRGPGLGFGSRGRHYESSDNYISWSDSIRAPSMTPVHHGAGSLISAGQLDSIQGKQESTNTNGGDLLHSHPTPRSVTRHLTDYSDDLFHVSSLTPAHQRASQSHSFPPRTSSPRRVVHDEQLAERHRTIDTVASSSAIERAITVRPDANQEHRQASQESLAGSQSPSRSPVKSESSRRRTSEGTGQLNDSIMVDPNPLPSSSLGKLLHECSSAFDKRRRQAATLRDHSEVPPGPLRAINNMTGLDSTVSSSTKRRLSTLRFADVETFRPLVQCSARPSVYEAPTHRERPLQSPLLEDEHDLQNKYTMLDDYGEIEEYGRRGYEDVGWDSVGDDTAPIGYDVGAVEDATHYDMEDGGLRHNQRNNVVARGFWRPHKLY